MGIHQNRIDTRNAWYDFCERFPLRLNSVFGALLPLHSVGIPAVTTKWTMQWTDRLWNTMETGIDRDVAIDESDDTAEFSILF